MSKPDEAQKPAPEREAPAATPAPGSGEGADTALEALIRKRRLAELPDTPDTLPPAPPPALPARWTPLH